MVGVPAHCSQAKIVHISKGFDAYGTVNEADPLEKSLEILSLQVSQLQARIDELEAQHQDVAKTAQSWEGKK